MRLAKTLIQKEIDRHNRSMQIDTDEIQRLGKLKKEPKKGRISDKEIGDFIKSHEKRTAVSKPIVKELEADLKKL